MPEISYNLVVKVEWEKGPGKSDPRGIHVSIEPGGHEGPEGVPMPVALAIVHSFIQQADDALRNILEGGGYYHFDIDSGFLGFIIGG